MAHFIIASVGLPVSRDHGVSRHPKRYHNCKKNIRVFLDSNQVSFTVLIVAVLLVKSYFFITDLPENVDMYAELLPLEGYGPHSLASSYRGTHRESCEYFALRRLHSYAHTVTTIRRLEIWKHIDHPNIVRFFEYFTTPLFGDNCK